MAQFSTPHLAALAALVASAAAAVWTGRRHPGRPTTILAWALAALIFAAWAGEYVADVVLGTWSVRYDLPLQLTDAVSLTAVVALITRRQTAIELVYLWSLSATLQATVTPDLGQDFPSIYYFTYFTYHVGAIVAACLLVFGLRRYPSPRAAWRTWGATLALAAVSGTADLLTGGNYMYLRAKPRHGSLLAVMGPWPWYIGATALLALGLLLALQWLAGAISRHDGGGAIGPAQTRA
jgi:hypothetical integral membrane protein (TIGR02206 family)